MTAALRNAEAIGRAIALVESRAGTWHQPQPTLAERLRRSLAFDPKPILDVIRGLANIHNNGDDTREDMAIEACAFGRPAYTTTASYSQAACCLVASNANIMGLPAALADFAGHVNPLTILATIVPLNPQGAVALRLEVERIAAERREISLPLEGMREAAE